jgi:hypothetical protein
MHKFEFYGVNGNLFKLNDTVWEAVEGEAGRGKGLINIVNKVGDLSKFPSFPLATVNIIRLEDVYPMYIFNDTKDRGHTWLKIGTQYDDTDFYYTPLGLLFDYKAHTSRKSTGQFAEWNTFIDQNNKGDK